MSDINERLITVMSRLEHCQLVLAEAGERDTAQLVAMAMLQLRMRIHHIGDAELKALCDAMATELEQPGADASEASGEGGR